MRALPINSAQRGAALLVVLVLLVAMMLIGLTAFYSSKQEERLARAGRDGLMAREAAEAALRYAEGQIASGVISGNLGFNSCPNSASTGLCSNYASGPMSVLLASAAISTSPTTVATVPSSAWNGGSLGSFSLQAPRYAIEVIPDQAPGSDLSTESYLYRITAWGFGFNSNIVTVTESVYRPSK
ncbi:PilX N-terminal domain-containing pilus assembly protein [Aquitalea sp. LB_tupeE]|uniref:pilus assembly PilX family protein n=1 Tax=Aquitalea sp. LB_tupeE TaxID=2748078 RepID=UPI0015BE1932|nr:PilX N-terminal domain-containing pilus assembly protein [Aquitalea sp. LB_tupeE]NWK77900.1 pilus assembly protein [Aquitalea sp. LB_tupeE]